MGILDSRTASGVSYSRLVWREFIKRKVNIAALIFILGLFLVAVFAPVIVGDKSYSHTDITRREMAPNAENWMGTDDVGGDVFCRLIYGSRVSLAVGFAAVVISCLIGIFSGAMMGYFGGKVEFVGMRLVEITMAIPPFFLVITIMAFFPRNIFNIMLIIGLTSWTTNARFIRAEFLKLREQDYITAARALGLPRWRVIFRHLLPNSLGAVLVNATFGIGGAIFIESALSYLGFGAPPPTPSWGQMLSGGLNVSGKFLWWLTLFPGLAIFLTVLACNIVGEGLRDAMDPKFGNRINI